MASIEVNLDKLEGDPHWGDSSLRNDYRFPSTTYFGGFASDLELRIKTSIVVTIISFAFLMHKEK